ncbi:xanthine dehydrogenase family protein molybdopterin-binding subunit [Schnuerera ultunensis]|uniref:Xanthine dehydrogenase, molybdenum binding subunit apoprotein n=1 Tax=[Clostridium] ultunense Esp TaxID=1288971 RepID=A0A1M4PKH3_9FIRM|nr:molybdopterin cofactor-binding domain-containing protein [Schnuerera ultunensis]SHD75971.1 Xanthine dehydrogenase, molybdenum binding subunit apoprotein [[Clostridium] ultunense Esp]
MNTVGKSLPRGDAYQKVSGEALYVDDIKMHGMLAGKVLRSPYPHAIIRDIKVERAKKLNGVIDVITYNDIPQIRYNPAAYPPTNVPGRMVLPKDMFIVTDKARYVGDPVAAVVAIDEEIAEEALSLIEVDYEPIEAYFYPFDSMKDDSLSIHECAEKNILHKYDVGFGDIDKGFKEADLIIEEEFSTSRISPAPIEPIATSIAMAHPGGDITIYSATQTPHITRRIIAEALGLGISKVRIIKPSVGGAFGGRHGVTNELIAAFLSIKTNQPVKLSYSREESLVCTTTRHPAYLKIKSGVKKDGSLTARTLDVVVDAGAYACHAAGVTRMMGLLGLSLYKCENLHFGGKIVYTNNPPAGGIRGYGNPQGTFAVESHTDTIARELNMDPLEYRLMHHVEKGDVNYQSGLEIDSCGIEECIKQGAKKIRWSEKTKSSSENKKHGKGMAIMIHISGTRPGLSELSTARITVNEDGCAYLSSAAAEIGQGITTSIRQIAAEALGFKYEDVKTDNYRQVDTMVDGYDMGAYASRQTFSNGVAVKNAALDARNKILNHASKMLSYDKDNLTIEDSIIKDANSKEELLKVADVVYDVNFKEDGQYIIGIGVSDIDGNSPPFAAQFAEVEVDIETGIVEVLNFVAAHDVGRAINPYIVEGQIEGAIQQGIGYALIEKLMVDNNGKVLNPEFANYKMLTSKDMPKIETLLIEEPSPIGPYGAKGVGEPGLVPVAPAIANAINDAIGVRIKELPMTPNRILKALQNKKD